MIALVLGGSRSGKSVVAERMAARLTPPVTYVATLDVGGDADLAPRVERHRARRPTAWRTLETAPVTAAARGRGDPTAPSGLPELLLTLRGSVLVDSLGPWVSASEGMDVDAAALCSALVERHGDTVVVSEEVGMAVHPLTDAGRLFVDALGALNQAVAACADEVLLVVAGRVLRLDRPEGC